MRHRVFAPTETNLQRISRLIFCCLSLLIASIVRADNTDAVSAKLIKLGYEEGNTVDRIEHYRVEGWNYIDDNHVVIYTGPSQRFLITTFNRCPDLSSAEHIGFTSTASYLTKFDKLIVRGLSGIVQNCPITEIRTLSKHAQQ